MGDIVNLRLFKKKKERKRKETLSCENRQIYGLSKIEKNFNKRKQKETQQFLDVNLFHGDDDKT